MPAANHVPKGHAATMKDEDEDDESTGETQDASDAAMLSEKEQAGEKPPAGKNRKRKLKRRANKLAAAAAGKPIHVDVQSLASQPQKSELPAKVAFVERPGARGDEVRAKKKSADNGAQGPETGLSVGRSNAADRGPKSEYSVPGAAGPSRRSGPAVLDKGPPPTSDES